MQTLAVSLAAVFAGLAGLHVFWALGGRFAFAPALPELDGKPAFMPHRVTVFAIAVLLLLASALALGGGGLLKPGIQPYLLRQPLNAFGLVLVLRCVGDFRFVGVFKRVRGTRFARLDSFVYSPLSFLLGFGMLQLAQAAGRT